MGFNLAFKWLSKVYLYYFNACAVHLFIVFIQTN